MGDKFKPYSVGGGKKEEKHGMEAVARSVWLLTINRFSLPVIAFLLAIIGYLGTDFLKSIRDDVSGMRAEMQEMYKDSSDTKVTMARVGSYVEDLKRRQDVTDGAIQQLWNKMVKR